MTRYAKRVDANQADIVNALRAVCRVWIIGLPTDLLLGITRADGERIFAFVEVKVQIGKRSPKPSATTDLQDKFMAEFSGWPVCLVDSPESALRHYKVLAGLA
jgi:hypothetical protein